MPTILALSLLVTLLLPAAAAAYHVRDKPVGYVDNHLHLFRLHTNTVRADKCLPRFQIGLAADELPPLGSRFRKEIRVTWKRRHWQGMAAASSCLSERLWSWFNTSGAACVKSKEGAWTSNTGNGYYGGFQADMSFQRAYGPEYLSRMGTANNWPPISQIHMAYRGWQARGWTPWPNTARMCGLL